MKSRDRQTERIKVEFKSGKKCGGLQQVLAARLLEEGNNKVIGIGHGSLVALRSRKRKVCLKEQGKVGSEKKKMYK